MSLCDRWTRYWFRRGHLVDLAILRILVVGFQLFVLLFPYAVLEYPPHALLEHYLGAFTDAEYQPPWILRLLTIWLGPDYRPSLEHLTAVYRVTILLGMPALLGFWTRPCLFLFALGNVVLAGHAYSYGEHHHIEALTMVALLAMPFSPCGETWSLDRRLRDRRRGERSSLRAALAERSDMAAWPLLLMRWMFALCYLSGAFCKLGGGGFDWLNGFTMQYYLLQDGLFWETSAGIWLGDQHTLCWISGWITILAEGLFFTVLLWPRLALVFVPVLIAMHVGIYVTMRAPFLHYLPLFAVFVPWGRLLQGNTPERSSRAVASA
jgi:hypothetical protein